MPYDPQLADLLRDALDGHPGIEEKKMFGGICWMLDGNMLCGVEVGRFMFRVGKDRTEEALARPGAEPMEMGGRVMGGLVWVDAKAAIKTGLDDWIVFASEFVCSLPAK
ncbi:MAG: TfoX/Sxy family protein [Thermoanaerobaculia bacterium]|nr:TfoX/Sxy family protein [Thermoanaerobaculia bacterium]